MPEPAPLRVARVDEVRGAPDRRARTPWSTCSSTAGGSGRSGPCATPTRGRRPGGRVAAGAAPLPRRHHPALGGRARVRPTWSSTRRCSLGTSADRIAVVDASGRPLGIDKSNRITTTFDTRDRDQTAPLLDSTEQVLSALLEAGVDAFPVYGTLLGAIREQDFIGHDSDVDLGYVSRHTAPARRDPGVLPAAAPPARAWATRSTATAPPPSRSTWSRPTVPSAGSTSSAATSSTGSST